MKCEDGNLVAENLHEQQVLNEMKLYKQRLKYLDELNKASKLIDDMSFDLNERIILKACLLKSINDD